MVHEQSLVMALANTTHTHQSRNATGDKDQAVRCACVHACNPRMCMFCVDACLSIFHNSTQNDVAFACVMIPKPR